MPDRTVIWWIGNNAWIYSAAWRLAAIDRIVFVARKGKGDEYDERKKKYLVYSFSNLQAHWRAP